jgi:hypothetical protein
MVMRQFFMQAARTDRSRSRCMGMIGSSAHLVSTKLNEIAATIDNDAETKTSGWFHGTMFPRNSEPVVGGRESKIA